LKNPGYDVDVVVNADLGTFTRVWLGYLGLAEAIAAGKIALHGSDRAVAMARQMLKLSDIPTPKRFSPPATAKKGSEQRHPTLRFQQGI
jgi:putative sterol carrier protein